MPEDETLPVVDIGDLSTDLDTAPTDAALMRVGRRLTDSLREIGFVYLKGHRFPQEQINGIFQAGSAFFDLPAEVKEEYSFDHRTKEGYAAVDRQRVGMNQAAFEIRESYDIKSFKKLPPEVVPSFESSAVLFLGSCRKLTNRILAAIAVGLDLDRDFFLDAHKDTANHQTPTVLRINHYPPVPVDARADAIRIAAHNDWGTITLLFQDDVGGLEVRHKSGQWIRADPITGTVLMNLAELLQFWTSDVLKPALHRVLIPEEETLKRKSRSSIAFFVNPDDNYLIRPINGSSEKQPILGKNFISNKYMETFQY